MSNNNLPMVIKENKFDKILKNLFRFIFKQEYELMYKIDKITMPKKTDTSKIIIPKEIKKRSITGERNEKHKGF